MKYSFVGYGSLLSHKSLQETIPNKKFKPVIVKGYKREFNLEDNKEKKDFLNLVKNKKSYFNGVMFEVDDKELIRLKKREDFYNLEQTSAYDFKNKKKLGKCFVVIDNFVSLDHKGELPNKTYFIMCREAAYHISKDFGKLWDKTTFTSNGEKIEDWIKKSKDYDTMKR
ncbi:gamma-glutamylcyclotransferase [Candidatus Pacearchaeota archaeon]|nr:gamma-glutamylcyclotransferase [Candidatus Pacearchaeota archaeon]